MSALRRTLWPLLGRRSLRLVGALTAAIVVAAGQLAHPFPLKLVLDHVLDGAAPQLDRGAVEVLVAAVALAVGIVVAEAIGGYLWEVGLRRIGEDVVHDLRVAVYDHLQRLSLRYHRRSHTGDVVTRLTGDVNAVGELCGESVGQLVNAAALLVGMVVVTISLDPVLAGVMLAVVPPLSLLTARFRRRLLAASRRQRTHDGAIAASATEALDSVETVRALNGTYRDSARLRRTSWRRRDAGIEVASVEGRLAGAIDVVGAVGAAAVLGIGTFRVAVGALSVGDLVVVYSYVRRLYRPLRTFARQAGRISRALARVERLDEVLATDDVLHDPPDGHRTGRATGALTFEAVRFAYDRDRGDVLQGIDLHVPAGTSIALVGASGAGKSTLAALAARFDDPCGGRVLLDGRDLRECSLSWLRSQIGFVLQDTALFTGTVAENIAYGMRASRGDVVAAARGAGAHEFITALPAGYDTPIGPRGLALSGGQRRRLALARALLRDPAVLILDEPTAGLDAATEEQVLQSLKALLHDRTTILVTHDIKLASRANQIAVVEAGRLVESGPPRTLLTGRGPFRSFAADQGVAKRAPIPAPPDPALPQLAHLLDVDEVAALLTRTRDSTINPGAIRIRYLRYKPATNLVVDYEIALTEGASTHAVVMVAADRNLAKRAARPVARDLAAGVRWHPQAPRSAIVHDRDLDALVQWFPADLWLPALGEPHHDLLRGLTAPHSPRQPNRMGDAAAETQWMLLAYKPRRRAVLRVDGHVVKFYAERAAFTAAARALLAAGRLPVMTPRVVAVSGARQVTVQPHLDGRTVEAVSGATEAGGLLLRMHSSVPPPGLATQTNQDVLAAARASAGLVRTLRPQRSDRLAALVERLATTCPPEDHPVLSHGDFHSRQLIDQETGLAVLDLDELCLATPGLDLATFIAHEVDGQEDDEGTIAALVDRLAAGYGSLPADLDWHLSAAVLRRAPFPFRKPPTPDWPERVDNLVATAEALVGSPC